MNTKRIDIASMRRIMADVTLTGFRRRGGDGARKDAMPKVSKMTAPKVSKVV